MIKTARPSYNESIFKVCEALASRATCRHREQGVVIVRDKVIIATGYNGAPRGVKDCIEKGYCSKAESLPCLAEGLHGESNALISAARHGVSVDKATMYCIYSPCRACCNMIRNAGIEAVIFKEVYSEFLDGPRYLASLGVTVANEIDGKLQIVASPILLVKDDDNDDV